MGRGSLDGSKMQEEITRLLLRRFEQNCGQKVSIN
jgi:hypothetical protein